MREIKFRAYDKQLGVFIATGFHVIGEVTMFNMIDQYCFENKGKTTTIDRYGDVEIMQYTGLKDKNGKEIYEGDIIESNYTRILYPIEYKGCAFVAEHPERMLSCNFYLWDKCEIKGNIHQHPELLTPKQ